MQQNVRFPAKVPYLCHKNTVLTYKSTNFMDKIQIGLNAGAIWNTMDANHDKHVWDVEELQQATGLSVPDFYAALGWLARENKVDFGEDGITHHGTVGLIVEFYH